MDHRGAKTYILERLKVGLKKDRTYHSLAHTIDVHAMAIDIGMQEGVQGMDMELLKTAALYHDSGFLESDKQHEQAGCAIARRELPRFGYDKASVEKVCDLIMATKIPQDPKDDLAMVLCDADLDYLGRSDFHQIGLTLFAEFKAYGVLSTEKEWNLLQVSFLERHRFFTATNEREREPRKQAHLAALREVVSGYA
ncbi:MAG: HD domain-containing protein [Flavobacteriales bacterium]|nr:HD domain-containing protein [Flavobacteriales bacterium]